jgi:hypothetical protein
MGQVQYETGFRVGFIEKMGREETFGRQGMSQVAVEENS